MNDNTPTELTALLAEGRWTFLMVARALVEADVAVCGWPLRTIEQAEACRHRGHRLELVVNAEASGAVAVSLVAVSRRGERAILGRVSETAAGKAN